MLDVSKERFYTLSVGGKTALSIAVHPGGSATLASNLRDDQGHVSWELDTKEAISARIFDHDYNQEHGETRPLKETCNELGEQIRNEIVHDPYEVSVDAVEAFILSLAAEGVDLNDQRFSTALESVLQTFGNRY